MSNIIPSLQPLTVPVETLIEDPENPMTHPMENLQAIAASLRLYGQRKPVVVNKRTGFVEAGNGTLVAARDLLSWTELAAVFVDDDAAAAAGFSVADNRTAQLATWNYGRLSKLLAGIPDATSVPGVDASFLAAVQAAASHGPARISDAMPPPATAQPGASSVGSAATVNQPTFIVYLVFPDPETFENALTVLSLGQNGLQTPGQRYAQIAGDSFLSVWEEALSPLIA